jgi:hypothetical protein
MKLEQSRAWKLRAYIQWLELKYGDLVIVETGTIRNAASRYMLGDGYSTEIIARYLKASQYKHEFYSVDLNTYTAQQYLKNRNLLVQVNLVQSDSVAFLQNFGKTINLAYLDSDNDATLALQEFQAIEGKMRGVVIMDDCDMDSHELVKGHLVIPYAQGKYKVELFERQGVIWFM